MFSAVAAFVTLASVLGAAHADCPPGPNGAERKLYEGAAVNASWAEEQCGHYASTIDTKPPKTCCSSEDVWVDRMMLIPGDTNSYWDNNNKGCKRISTECNDWMMFYLCGINCSPDFSTYSSSVDTNTYPGGYRVCEKILADLRENCNDDEWPEYWPNDPDKKFDPNNVQCKDFPDLFPDNDDLATKLFGAQPEATPCYNAGTWFGPHALLLAVAFVLTALRA